MLIVLWFVGYVPITGLLIPDLVLFSLNSHPITLWDILILLVISWAIGLLPRPLRDVASVILVLWILSVLGILAFAGLSNILVLVIIIGLILSILGVV